MKNIYLNKKNEVLPELYSLHISLPRQFEIAKTRQKQDERFFTLSTEEFKKAKKNPGEGIYQHPRKVKSFKLEDLPEEWKNLTLMKWGGKVTLELGKEIVLSNTFPIDSLLWISNCWYNSNPEMLSTINEARLSVTECFSSAVSLMLSGNLGDAKVNWLSICDETAYEGLKKQGHLIDYWGTEVGMSHGPLSSLFERKFKSSCTSPRCLGFKNRSLHGTDLNFIKDSVDLV